MLLPETRAALLSNAVHEAGHAVAGVLLGFDLRYVAIHPGAVTAWRVDEEDDERPEPGEGYGTAKAAARATRIDALAEDGTRFEALLRGVRDVLPSETRIADYLIMLRAARAAQELIGPERDGALAQAADDLTTESLVLCALDDPRRMVRVDLRTRALSADLVRKHRDAIVEVAARLAERGRLEGDEVRGIVGGVLPESPPRVPAGAEHV